MPMQSTFKQVAPELKQENICVHPILISFDLTTYFIIPCPSRWLEPQVVSPKAERKKIRKLYSCKYLGTTWVSWHGAMWSALTSLYLKRRRGGGDILGGCGQRIVPSLTRWLLIRVVSMQMRVFSDNETKNMIVRGDGCDGANLYESKNRGSNVREVNNWASFT